MEKHKHNWIAKADKSKYCSSCGAEKGLKVYFLTGYAGAVKCEARIDGVEHVIEIEQVIELLTKLIKKNGYEITKTNRQKYPRLVINK